MLEVLYCVYWCDSWESTSGMEGVMTFNMQSCERGHVPSHCARESIIMLRVLFFAKHQGYELHCSRRQICKKIMAALCVCVYL